MSPKTVDIITRKLEHLCEYLKILRELKSYPKKRFVEDYRIYGLAERYMHLSIEVILDVGRLTCVEKGFPSPDNNHEIFEILESRKVISKKLLAKIRGIAGFRNILVHDYMKIDRAIVFDHLQELSDLEKFRKAIEKTLYKV